MRKAFFTLLVASALAVPASVLAEVSTKGDGTLSVNDGNGKISLTARGIVFGRMDSGKITIVDYNPDDLAEPEFFDTCKLLRSPTDTTTVCQGTGLRFRFAAGKFDLRVSGRGINITAVGKGQGSIAGLGTLDDGTYSLNGAQFRDLPLLAAPFVLGQPAALPVGAGG